MAFVRLVVFGFLFLSIVYVCVSLYSRSVRRERLEDDWAEEPRSGMTREEFIAAGMADYESGLRKRLLLLIYVVPSIAVGLIIYFIN